MISEQKPYKCRQWLKQKYCNEGFSLREIAGECGVAYNTIRYHLIKFNIKGRVRDWGKNQEEISVYSVLPKYFHDALTTYSIKTDKTKAGIIKEALTEYLIKNGFNPFKEN